MDSASLRMSMLLGVLLCWSRLGAFGQGASDPDELYRRREDIASAQRAAALWAAQSTTDFDAAWKLARVSYWLGGHAPERDQRRALELGVSAAESAVRLRPDRPEGHFWLAANMGMLAERFGMMLALKYRARIKEQLERVVALDASWSGGLGDAALGQWYFDVPRLLGGDRTKAELHLRAALRYDPVGRQALSTLADLLIAERRWDEARAALQAIVAAPLDPEWLPEDREYRASAMDRLRSLPRVK